MPAQSGFRVTGADELGRIAAELKRAGSKELQKSMRKRLREGVKPIVADVKAACPSSAVARSIVAEFRYSQDNAAVGIKAKRSRMPSGKEGLPQLLEFGSAGSGGRYIRHPVFGTETRVNQPIQPFFYRTTQAAIPRVQQVVEQVLDDVARAAGFR